MKFYTRKRRMPAVIIVSLIDILAILLIFVIVTTTFKSSQSEIVFKLPESKSAEPVQGTAEPKILMIDPSGDITFEGEKFTFDSTDDNMVKSQMAKLTARLVELKKKIPDAHFALQGASDANFGKIIKVIDAFKDADIKNLPAFMETPGTDSAK